MDGNYKHRKTMKKRILYYIWMACTAVLLHSCEDVETHKTLWGWQWTNAPGTVQVTSYEQIPGGVTLKFIAPTDEDLIVYQNKNIHLTMEKKWKHVLLSILMKRQ